MTIDNHKEAAANDDMDPIVELDTNMEEIRKLLNKIQYMSNTKASAASELIIEAVEDIYQYISNDTNK